MCGEITDPEYNEKPYALYRRLLKRIEALEGERHPRIDEEAWSKWLATSDRKSYSERATFSAGFAAGLRKAYALQGIKL